MKRIIPLALVLMLGGCVHLPSFKINKAAAPPSAAAQARPACPGSLTAEIPVRPALGLRGAFPAPDPEKPEEVERFTIYGEWLAALGGYMRSLRLRAETAKSFCEGKPAAVAPAAGPAP